MNKTAYHILRVGLGITFAAIGYMILRAPDLWASFLQPWAVRLVPGSLYSMMISTAWLDIAVGVFLIANVFTWLAALIGAGHIAIVLVTCGITDITVRDIGLFTAALALSIERLPAKLRFWNR